jgi:hypothetical protein
MVIKGLKALSIDSSTGVTLASKGKFCISNFQGLGVLSLRDPLWRSTQKGIRCCCNQNSTQQPSTFRRTYKSTCPTAHEQSSFSGCFLENKVSTVCQQPPTFVFQETHFFDSKTPTRPTYNVSSKSCSQWHQGQGVQKVHPTRKSSSSLRARRRIPSKKRFPLSKKTRVS